MSVLYVLELDDRLRDRFPDEVLGEQNRNRRHRGEPECLRAEQPRENDKDDEIGRLLSPVTSKHPRQADSETTSDRHSVKAPVSYVLEMSEPDAGHDGHIRLRARRKTVGYCVSWRPSQGRSGFEGSSRRAGSSFSTPTSPPGHLARINMPGQRRWWCDGLHGRAAPIHVATAQWRERPPSSTRGLASSPSVRRQRRRSTHSSAEPGGAPFAPMAAWIE